MDRSKYCTLSRVVRWGFMFSDYMCSDLALDMNPGSHIPQGTNCGVTLSTTRSFIDDSQSFSDAESFVSFTSGSEATSTDKCRRRFAEGACSAPGYLATAGRPPKLELSDTIEYVGQIPEENRWSERNKIQVREPNSETFNFNHAANTSSVLNKTMDSTCTSVSNRQGRYAAILAARAVMCIEDDNAIYVNPSSADTSLRSSGRGKLFN